MNYDPNIINLNFGAIYTSNSPNITNANLFNLNIINDNILIDTDTGIITILENLKVAKYDLIIECIQNNQMITGYLTIIISPNIVYDLININNNCQLIPILHPPLNILTDEDLSLFSFDTSFNEIIINPNTGIIDLNNLLINTYSFTVSWNLNSIISNFFINFTIKPIFYYQPNELILNYGDNYFSELPIIIPTLTSYNIISNSKISNSGILDFSNYDLGIYKINIILTTNNISVSTDYNLSVIPILSYLDYIGNAFTILITDKPNVSQLGGIFTISGDISYFSINQNTGIITINAPSNIYKLVVNYTKNNVSNFCFINIIINPIISYNNIITYSNIVTYSELPISNEIINGIFQLNTNYNNVYIDISSGILQLNYLEPNIYIFSINYNKNDCITNIICKVSVYPYLNIITQPQIVKYGDQLENVIFEIIPTNVNYNLTCDNQNIEIFNNYLSLKNIILVNNYNINLTLSINNQVIYQKYNFTIIPIFKYNNALVYCNYNEIFISDLPIISTSSNNTSFLFYINNPINNINIDANTGIITAQNLDVGQYVLEIHYKTNSYDIFTDFSIIIKPIIFLPIQNIIYSNTINGLIYYPPNGLLTLEPIYDIPNLDCGSYNITVNYLVNNINANINSSFNIIKKKIFLNLYVPDKIYDGTLNVLIMCLDISNIIIDASFTDPNVGYNKNIIINNLILPENLNNNFYTEQTNITGNIIPQILVPNIISFDKIYDKTLNANIQFNIIPNILLSYTASYDNINIGLQNITINNISISGYNYILSSNIYIISASILPKNVYANFIGSDKIYDGTNSSSVILQNINGVLNKDTIIIKNVASNFINSNVGYNEIQITNYQISGYNSNNYLLNINIIMANINPQPIIIPIISQDKIYDGLTNANVIFNSDINIISYNAFYNDKNVNKKKIIKVSNIILENSNYYMLDCILYGNILPKYIEFNFNGDDKVYDGNSICTGNYIINTLPNDNVLCIFNAEFKNIITGNNKDLIINNLKLTGTDSINYKINSVKTNNPSIIKKELIITFTNIDKLYDKTTQAFVQINTVSGILDIDKYNKVQITSLEANYNNYYCETNKNITINNIILEPSLINYTVNNTNIIGNILPNEIILNISPISKEYDETTNIDINIINTNNILQNDIVYVESFNANFIDSYAGSNKIVNINNIILNGDHASNYICNNFKMIGNIIKKSILINFIATDQEYTENLIPKLTYTLNHNFIDIAFYKAVYLNISIGIQKILITNIILSGINANNYSVGEQIITGNITPKYIKLNFMANDKLYNGTTDVIINYTNNINITYNAYFEDPNIGLKKVFINDISLNNLNYITDTNIIIYANILPIKLFINPSISKIYNETNIGVLLDLTTNINNVNIISYSCIYSNINVGFNIPVKIYNIILNNPNYIINDFETVGNIYPLYNNILFIIKDKYYDCSNNVYITDIISNINVKSYNAYYNTINIGLNQVNIENIILEDTNYYTNNIYLQSTILPTALQIDFIVKPKIYDNIKSAIIDSYTILNTTDKINIISYVANYISTAVGLQEIIITNIIIDTNNYYTTAYYTYSLINPIVLNINFINLNKYYDKTFNTNIEIQSINNILQNNDVSVSYFNSMYSDYKVNNNINIYISNITLTGINSNNYIVSNYTLSGSILPKIIDCTFKFINNIIIGTLNNIIDNDNVFINNYISYQQNNNTYVHNITLAGVNKNNYTLSNNLYLVSN